MELNTKDNFLKVRWMERDSKQSQMEILMRVCSGTIFNTVKESITMFILVKSKDKNGGMENNGISRRRKLSNLINLTMYSCKQLQTRSVKKHG